MCLLPFLGWVVRLCAEVGFACERVAFIAYDACFAVC